MKWIGWFVVIWTALAGCSSRMKNVLEIAGENRGELERVVAHYDSLGEKQKRMAAEFLIGNMGNKYSFTGEVIGQYDTLFRAFSHIWQKGEKVGDSEEVKQLWQELTDRYGGIRVGGLQRRYDVKEVSADFLIGHIDEAFEAWAHSPLKSNTDFKTFCRYILPHRVGHEELEDYRFRYRSDTALQFEAKMEAGEIAEFLDREIHRKRQFRNSDLLWGYPLDIPVSRMELGRRGACRHMVGYYAAVMRALGIPAAVDRAVWANRSQGHTWNVIMLDSARIFPFDALEKRRFKPVYIPAKIFRKVYDAGWEAFDGVRPEELPPSFLVPDEEDVTDQYVTTYDITVKVAYPCQKSLRSGIICVFDNAGWRPVYWGKLRRGKLHFGKMAAGVLYLAAFYEDGKIVPAADPFVLKEDGTLQFYGADQGHCDTMKLTRKYPMMERIRKFAGNMTGSRVEGANSPDFKDAVCLMTINAPSYIVTDSVITDRRYFRYVRMHLPLNRHGDFAEVEFYGKKSEDGAEELLCGKVTGAPGLDVSPRDNYVKAMDGRLDTWFSRRTGIDGWVGLDLGAGNRRRITRVRFCPRSDTNFVMPGDEYELFYWVKDTWKSMGRQVAKDYFVVYPQVPSGGLYLLSNHSRGKEERIFTYKSGQQLWW